MIGGSLLMQIMQEEKNLIVTGRLEIYGPTDFDEATYLTKSVEAGSTLIHVNSANGWKIGD